MATVFGILQSAADFIFFKKHDCVICLNEDQLHIPQNFPVQENKNWVGEKKVFSDMMAKPASSPAGCTLCLLQTEDLGLFHCALKCFYFPHSSFACVCVLNLQLVSL